MRNEKIIITKAEILEEVSLQTAYSGAKYSNEEDCYDRVATVEEDTLLLSSFWEKTCGTVTEKFRDFIIETGDEDAVMELTLQLSRSFDISLLASVKSDIKGGIVAGIMAQWMGLTLPEREEEWQKESVRLLERAFFKLCYRKKPSRK